MTAREYLTSKEIITEENTDLQIGFTDGSSERLTKILDGYHQHKLKILGLHSVSKRTSLAWKIIALFGIGYMFADLLRYVC